MNQRELSYTTLFGPEMEERTCQGAGISIGALLGSRNLKNRVWNSTGTWLMLIVGASHWLSALAPP